MSRLGKFVATDGVHLFRGAPIIVHRPQEAQAHCIFERPERPYCAFRRDLSKKGIPERDRHIFRHSGSRHGHPHGRTRQTDAQRFLRLGDRPIIEESISRLLEVGVRRIVIVTGHLAGFYHALQARHPDVVQLVHNPYYADSGSMYSLYCARRYVREDFLLLESDLIYERQALTALLEYPEDNVVLLSGFTKSSDEVFAQTNSGCLVAAARVIPVNCHVVEDLARSEMDDEWQLIRARDKIYPAILQRDNQTAPIARESGQDGRRLRNHRAALSDRAGAAVLAREGTKKPQ